MVIFNTNFVGAVMVNMVRIALLVLAIAANFSMAMDGPGPVKKIKLISSDKQFVFIVDEDKLGKLFEVAPGLMGHVLPDDNEIAIPICGTALFVIKLRFEGKSEAKFLNTLNDDQRKLFDVDLDKMTAAVLPAAFTVYSMIGMVKKKREELQSKASDRISALRTSAEKSNVSPEFHIYEIDSQLGREVKNLNNTAEAMKAFFAKSDQQIQVDALLEHLRIKGVPNEEKICSSAFLVCDGFFRELAKMLSPFKSCTQSYVEKKLERKFNKFYEFDIDDFSVMHLKKKYKTFPTNATLEQQYQEAIKQHSESLSELKLARKQRNKDSFASIYANAYLCMQSFVTISQLIEQLEEEQAEAQAAAPKIATVQSHGHSDYDVWIDDSSEEDEALNHVEIHAPRRKKTCTCSHSQGDALLPRWRVINGLARLSNSEINQAVLRYDLTPEEKADAKPRGAAVAYAFIDGELGLYWATKSNVSEARLLAGISDLVHKADALAQHDVLSYKLHTKKWLKKLLADFEDRKRRGQFSRDLVTEIIATRFNIDLANLALVINKSLGSARYDKDFEMALRTMRVKVIDNPSTAHPELALAQHFAYNRRYFKSHGNTCTFIGSHIKNCYMCHTLIHGRAGTGATAAIKGFETPSFLLHTPGYMPHCYQGFNYPARSLRLNDCGFRELESRIFTCEEPFEMVQSQQGVDIESRVNLSDSDDD